MSLPRLCLLMLLVLALAAVVAIGLGETPFSLAQYVQALGHPASPPGEVLWTIRAPRVAGGMNAIAFNADGTMTGAACWRADGTPVAISGGLARAGARFSI